MAGSASRVPIIQAGGTQSGGVIQAGGTALAGGVIVMPAAMSKGATLLGSTVESSKTVVRVADRQIAQWSTSPLPVFPPQVEQHSRPIQPKQLA